MSRIIDVSSYNENIGMNKMYFENVVDHGDLRRTTRGEDRYKHGNKL